MVRQSNRLLQKNHPELKREPCEMPSKPGPEIRPSIERLQFCLNRASAKEIKYNARREA